MRAAGEGLRAMTGFLGTRADVFMDLAITFFVAAPFLMTYALRLAARGRYKAHRNLQAGLVVGGTLAVLLLEGSIQYGEAMAVTYAGFWFTCITGVAMYVLCYAL